MIVVTEFWAENFGSKLLRDGEHTGPDTWTASGLLLEHRFPWFLEWLPKTPASKTQLGLKKITCLLHLSYYFDDVFHLEQNKTNLCSEVYSLGADVYFVIIQRIQ